MAVAYAEWKKMVRAAYHPKDARYQEVGARGIQVHTPWRESFENFVRDMGEPPHFAFLTREDSSQDFVPGNVYWVANEV